MFKELWKCPDHPNITLVKLPNDSRKHFGNQRYICPECKCEWVICKSLLPRRNAV